LLSANWNRLKLDKTKWYTIDYERLKDLEQNEAEMSHDQCKQLEWKVVDGVMVEVLPEIHMDEKEVPFFDIESKN